MMWCVSTAIAINSLKSTVCLNKNPGDQIPAGYKCSQSQQWSNNAHTESNRSTMLSCYSYNQGLNRTL